MHRPLEKGSCVGGGIVLASLSPSGVTLWMEEDSSEVGDGFVPFSTSEATIGGSLFVMIDMVRTQLPPTVSIKGFQNCLVRNGRNSGSRQADNDKKARRPCSGFAETTRIEKKEKGEFHHWHGGKRIPQAPQPRPLWGKRRLSAGMWAERANGEYNRNLRLSPADQDRCDPEAGTSFTGRCRGI